jgi:hypothetical protein
LSIVWARSKPWTEEHAWIVLHQLREGDLTADDALLEKDRLTAGAGCVETGGEARGPAADDHGVICLPMHSP